VTLGLRNYTHVGIRSGVAGGDVLALAEPPLAQQAPRQVPERVKPGPQQNKVETQLPGGQ
jgi:hypothetical protein